ncbi:MAG TPA: carboxypeptidase regulatory-like domain-containing protein, partial [Pyrinomonadaceae bacterium]|nr:carboxypeptidase regulatory-like domain-containing protein [Pyrinomonadaceae bacterium]
MNSNDASLKHTRQILSFAFMVTAAAASLILAIGGSAQSPTANVAIMGNGNMSYGNMASYSPTPEPPKTTIRGRAVYEDTGRPVRRASIMLMNSKGGGRELSAITDNNGAFEVRNATEGRYYAVINSPGVLTPVAYFDFAAASEREGMASGLEEAKTLFDEINVGAGGGTIDVFVRAKRGGAVGGRIMYADGDPAIGVKVEVLRKKDEKYLSIIPNLTEIFAAAMGGSAGGGKTDDRGIYRISGLPPGDYIVRVTEPASHRDSDDRGRGMFGPIGLGVSSLVSTYHPDVSDSKQAAVIKLEAGQEAAEVNITIPERLFQDVLGKVVARGNRQPVRGARISLLRKDDTVSFFDRLNEEGPGSGEATDEQGTFFFKELPPGNYLL